MSGEPFINCGYILYYSYYFCLVLGILNKFKLQFWSFLLLPRGGRGHFVSVVSDRFDPRWYPNDLRVWALSSSSPSKEMNACDSRVLQRIVDNLVAWTEPGRLCGMNTAQA